MRHIDNVIFHILVYHKPRTTAQSQSFTLANGMKPVSAVLSDNLSGFQFYDRPRTFSQETADKIIVIYLSQETDALAVFSSALGKEAFNAISRTSSLRKPPKGNIRRDTCR